MARRTRVGVLALVGTISAPVVVAGMAWACGPSGYGVPEAPPAPPASTAQPVAPAATAPAATPQAPPAVSVQFNSGVARSVDRGTSSPQSQSRPTQRGTTTPNTAGRDISARIDGRTAGTVERGGQSVFASSTPTGAVKPKAKSRKAAKSPAAKSIAPAVSERSATGDLWSGVTGSNPSLASADAMGKQDGGLSGGAIAGLAILGLGLAGLTGGALVLAAGRRRRAAGSAGAPKRR